MVRCPPSTSVHLIQMTVVRRPKPSMRWTLGAKILVRCPHGRVDGWTSADGRLRPLRLDLAYMERKCETFESE